MQNQSVLKDEIGDEEIRLCYEIAATIVAQFGDKYLPIFLRVHNEIERRKATNKMVELAKSVARIDS